MIRFQPGALSSGALSFLRARQARVDAKVGRQNKYLEAKRLFSLKSNGAFREIRSALEAASPTADACVYCERDRHREIEHVKPQRHYPESAFDWENYVLSCTVCNQDRKNDRFAVIDAALNLIEFNRFSLAVHQPVPVGTIAIINPRVEDPMSFFFLDLPTGELVVQAPTVLDSLRACFTRDLFDLNNDAFMRIRRGAATSLRGYASEYQRYIAIGDGAGAQRVLSEIKEHPHPTVLAELKRQNQFTDIPI